MGEIATFLALVCGEILFYVLRASFPELTRRTMLVVIAGVVLSIGLVFGAPLALVCLRPNRSFLSVLLFCALAALTIDGGLSILRGRKMRRGVLYASTIVVLCAFTAFIVPPRRVQHSPVSTVTAVRDMPSQFRRVAESLDAGARSPVLREQSIPLFSASSRGGVVGTYRTYGPDVIQIFLAPEYRSVRNTTLVIRKIDALGRYDLSIEELAPGVALEIRTRSQGGLRASSLPTLGLVLPTNEIAQVPIVPPATRSE